MIQLHAINVFGTGTALVGVGGLCVAVQAGREAWTLARIGQYHADWAVLGAMLLVALVNVMIIAAGMLVALIDI